MLRPTPAPSLVVHAQRARRRTPVRPDEPVPNHPRPTKRDQLAWGDLSLDGPYLNPVDPGLALERQFRSDAAHFGWLLFQQPARAAFDARALLGAIASGSP